ncbi:hypothetical protein BKL70_13670 [Staphylococcus aureus]|uniref:type I toxin-antitoxin system Fst family toxin n=1 Tax=Staphylococcus aureus TaxID=1280 RepID=UPI0008DAC809|nr:hypothetical protein BKL70_13670 [Staphylococcus aureus]
MLIIFVRIIAPVISGCAVAYYTYWLSKRQQIINRRLYKPAIEKSPHYCNSVGIGALIVNHFRYINYNTG